MEKPKKQHRLLAIFNLLLLSTQLYIGIFLCGFLLAKDKFAQFSVYLSEGNHAFIASPILDFISGKWTVAIVAFATLFCVFYKDKKISSIKNRVLINMAAVSAFFLFALFFVIIFGQVFI